jgi:asparagine synthase (glutamine-hydrolysing)
MHVRSYWDVTDWESDPRRSEQSYLEELDALLRRAVEERLEADVPLGAFLSGGVDSSVVVAHMARAIKEPVKTFSVRFEGPRHYDESPQARLVAGHCGTEHRELTVRPHVLADLPRLVWHWDEPFAVSSAVAVYYMAKAAREHVKVVLTGDGGDEVFGGYPRYGVDHALALAARLPLSRIFPSPGHAELRNLPDWLRRMFKFASAAALGYDRGYAYIMSVFSEAEKRLVLSGDLLAELGRAGDAVGEAFADRYRSFAGRDPIARRLYGDLKLSLPDEMLAKVDRMTMAVGLEARPPLLDHHLVEFAARIPSRLKVRGRAGKYILRQHALRWVPRAAIERPKHGFSVPLDEWLRGELRDLVRDLLTDPRAASRDILDPRGVAKILTWHDRGVGNWGQHIWTLLVFELWCRMMAEAASTSSGALAEPRA